ncbi:MAG: hypothetical protein K2O91_06310 [Lachnospiraceae bacterium]|nr:hypothetical protein [Lachnospiraceae bacterium]
MEQMELDARKRYTDLTEELRRTQESAVENFIVIGFILKQVEAERLYRFDNFKDIYEYGKQKFGQSRATVSRCKNINTKYSVGGNSRELRPEYKGYYKSTLQEMLDLSESDMDLITAKTPVDQAQELKKAIKVQKALEKEEQENNLPLIQMAAGEETCSEAQEPEPIEPFEAMLTAFWQKNIELYQKVAAGLITPEIIAEEISPSGSMTFRNGANIIFFYDINKGLKLRSYEKGKAEITAYSYQELLEKTQKLDFARNQGNEKEAPESAENISPPEKEPVATSQSVHEEEEQDASYTPVPGQTSVSDLQSIMPDETKDPYQNPMENQDSDTDEASDNDNVIEGEYRELNENTNIASMEEECPYTDIEIKNAISFFDIEYSRMTGLQQDTTKRRNYKIALECIRRCYKSIAEQADSAMYGTGA